MPEDRTDTERDAVAPDSARDRRPDTERRDVAEREDREDCEDARELLCTEPLRESRDPLEDALPPPVTPVAVAAIMPVGDTTGASPQVSQYISPPPMSSYVPPQPGR
ncbi:hypothetical protein [Streptomyces sp. NPDC054863]